MQDIPMARFAEFVFPQDRRRSLPWGGAEKSGRPFFCAGSKSCGATFGRAPPPTPPPRPTTDHAPVPSVVGRGGGVGRWSRKSANADFVTGKDSRGGQAEPPGRATAGSLPWHGCLASWRERGKPSARCGTSRWRYRTSATHGGIERWQGIEWVYARIFVGRHAPPSPRDCRWAPARNLVAGLRSQRGSADRWRPVAVAIGTTLAWTVRIPRRLAQCRSRERSPS